MRTQSVCRFCGELPLGGWFHRQRLRSRQSFIVPGAIPHYAPDRPFRVEHILLNLKIDPRAKTLSGSVRQRIRVVAAKQRVLKLDQIGIQFEEAKINHQKVDFTLDSQSVSLVLPQSAGSEIQPGTLLDVEIQYSVPHPRRGIYFTGPDPFYPNKTYQVWTQGQDEDNRYWIPTLDYPNQKATSEVIATVPQGFIAVSNGELVSKKQIAEEVSFHYRLGVPHVTYLITLVVAEFVEWADLGPRNLPVQYFVPKGRQEDGQRAFRNTPKMIEAFEQKTGIQYPYEKYSQVAVQDFIFGGMENTSATTQTDLTLHDARASLDFTSDPLVSHELAHQWFGDLVTCRDWSHGWLNEGFATFMERVWIECNSQPGGGFEEAKYYSYQDLKEYLADDQSQYRRPIVCNTYLEPIDLFDTHLYQKGGLVLNLLRFILGEEPFWKSVNTYLTRHRGQTVETLDLVRAIEDTTGKNLRRVMDEWVYSGGHPEFVIAYQWHEESMLAEWVIEQKQTGGAESIEKDGVFTRIFHLPVLLEMNLADGSQVSETIQLSEARERIFIRAASKPTMVRFDPHSWIPKTLKFPRPKPMLLTQLSSDSDCMGRIEAIHELLQIADPEIVKALGVSVSSDLFWGVQVEAAKALAEVRSDLARDQLIAALGTRHPKARRAIVAALGSYQDQKSVAALLPLASRDESYFVESEAIFAFSHARLKSTLSLEKIVDQSEIDQIESFLMTQISKDSYRDVIRASVLNALAELPGAGTGARPSVLKTLMDWSQCGHSPDIRGAAVRGLGRILQSARPTEKAQILAYFNHLGDEDQFRIRTQLVIALEDSGCTEAIPILNKIGRLDSDGRVKRAARIAKNELMVADSVPASVMELKAAFEKLEEDYKKLRAKFEEKAAGTGASSV